MQPRLLGMLLLLLLGVRGVARLPCSEAGLHVDAGSHVRLKTGRLLSFPGHLIPDLGFSLREKK